MEHKKPIVQRPWDRVVVSDVRRQVEGSNARHCVNVVALCTLLPL